LRSFLTFYSQLSHFRTLLEKILYNSKDIIEFLLREIISEIKLR
jgi:hypothetical protein